MGRALASIMKLALAPLANICWKQHQSTFSTKRETAMWHYCAQQAGAMMRACPTLTIQQGAICGVELKPSMLLALFRRTLDLAFRGIGWTSARLQRGPHIINARAAVQAHVDGGLHAAAHGHQVRREADPHIRPRRIAQALRSRPAHTGASTSWVCTRVSRRPLEHSLSR